jgi:hypothetical protein
MVQRKTWWTTTPLLCLSAWVYTKKVGGPTDRVGQLDQHHQLIGRVPAGGGHIVVVFVDLSTCHDCRVAC